MPADRAILFIDGNNWYHALKAGGVPDLGRLCYRRVSEKLVGPRTWIGTRYYIGQMDQTWSAVDYAKQRSFLAQIAKDDSRITAHLGRLERRRAHSDGAEELLRYLANLSTRIDATVYHELLEIGKRHRITEVLVEKAVDVMMAVDLVIMAERNLYDAAYVLTADGDFTPAVNAVRAHKKKVYAASPERGAQLAGACNSFIRLEPSWFVDCYRDP